MINRDGVSVNYSTFPGALRIIGLIDVVHSGRVIADPVFADDCEGCTDGSKGRLDQHGAATRRFKSLELHCFDGVEFGQGLISDVGCHLVVGVGSPLSSVDLEDSSIGDRSAVTSRIQGGSDCPDNIVIPELSVGPGFGHHREDSIPCVGGQDGKRWIDSDVEGGLSDIVPGDLFADGLCFHRAVFLGPRDNHADVVGVLKLDDRKCFLPWDGENLKGLTFAELLDLLGTKP